VPVGFLFCDVVELQRLKFLWPAFVVFMSEIPKVCEKWVKKFSNELIAEEISLHDGGMMKRA
jgi:hypothetical protein